MARITLAILFFSKYLIHTIYKKIYENYFEKLFSKSANKKGSALDTSISLWWR